MTTYFTSDTHFGHTRIIEFANRPFKSVEEMDEKMIANWNATVKTGDIIFHLGDFAFCDEQRICSILDRLAGQKFYIFGNHDKEMRRTKVRQKFCKVDFYHELTIDGQGIVLCHYPMITWNKCHYGAWMLHGHCHGNLRYPFPAKIMDVGVDPQGYFPVDASKLKRHMDAQPINKVDHHEPRRDKRL